MKPRNFREILNIVDAFLAVQDEEAGKLWAVLTALRGDDVDDNIAENSKPFNTGVIRQRAFPRTAAAGETSQTAVYRDEPYTHPLFDKGCSAGPRPIFATPETGYQSPMRPGHFRNHNRDAARVLGLE